MAKKINSVFIATFAPWKDGRRESTNGMIEPLLYYFKPRLKRVYLLEQPYPGSDRIIPFVHIFINGKEEVKENFFTKVLYPILKYENSPGTKISFKLRDFFSVIETGLSFEKKVDLFIGLESINTLAGILLKKMGKVKTVAYYVSDYSPNRYPSKLFNSFYLYLDRFCAKHTDYIWDVSKAMQPARLKEGLKVNESKPVIDIPNALFKEQISFSDKKKPLTAVFVGTLGLANGPDLAIEAFSIVTKKYPKAILHIIGGRGAGYEEKHLEKLIKKYKLEKNVVMHGFISDVKEISQLIKSFQVALAPYKMIEGSIRLYGDATKIRLYLAAGLPVITTKVPPLGQEAAKKGAAVIVGDNKEELAEAILKLFSNKELRNKITLQAIRFAKKNTWENTYGTALKKMNFILPSIQK